MKNGDRYLVRLFDSFLKVPYELLHADMEKSEILFFSFIANHYSFFKQAKRDKDGFVYCSSKLIQEKLNMPIPTQTRCTRKLKKLGWLEVRRMGMPAKNYYKIRGEVVRDTVSSRRLYKHDHGDDTSMIKMARHNKIYKRKIKRIKSTSKDVDKKVFDFQSHKNIIARVKEERVIRYWNNKPFATHQVGVGTKTEKNLRRYISRYADKGDKLIDFYFAIDAWDSLLQQKFLKVRFVPNFSMVDFFSPRDGLRQMFRKAKVKIRSPFVEAKKGYPHLLQLFQRENKYPEVAEVIEDKFKNHFVNAITHEEDFRRAAEYFVDIQKTYDMNPRHFGCLDSIFESLTHIRSSGIIASKNFWQGRATELLVENGWI